MPTAHVSVYTLKKKIFLSFFALFCVVVNSYCTSIVLGVLYKSLIVAPDTY